MRKRKGGWTRNTSRVALTLFGSTSMPTILWVVVMIIMLGWAGDSLRDLLEFWLQGNLCNVLPSKIFTFLSEECDAVREHLVKGLQVLLFFFVLALLVVVARRYTANELYKIEKSGARVENLVCFLSALDSHKYESMDLWLENNTGKPEFTGEFERFPWQQNIAALCHEDNHIKNVCVIGSIGMRERKGSSEQFPLFEKLARRFVDPDCTIELVQKRINYEEVPMIFEAANEAATHLEARPGNKTRTAIDVTAGMKPVAIGGAMAAMRPGRLLMYVNAEQKVAQWDLEHLEE